MILCSSKDCVDVSDTVLTEFLFDSFAATEGDSIPHPPLSEFAKPHKVPMTKNTKIKLISIEKCNSLSNIMVHNLQYGFTNLNVRVKTIFSSSKCNVGIFSFSKQVYVLKKYKISFSWIS